MPTKAQQSPMVSPMITPQIMATNEIQDPASPLSVYDDMAASKDGISDSGSPAEVTRDTTVTVAANSYNGSQRLVTQDDPPLPDDPVVGVEIARGSHGFKGGTGQDGESALMQVFKDATQHGTTNITEHNDQTANDDLLDLGCMEYSAETAAIESGSHMSPNPEPASSSVKRRQSTKRRTKTTIHPDNLPGTEDELSETQIASLCSQPPRIRQRFARYFASSGTIRAAYSNILLERLPDGGPRFPEEIIRSCFPKWKDRLETSEPGQSTQPGAGHSRKRKGTGTPAKRVADEEIDSARKTKKPNGSKSEELPVYQGGSDHTSQAQPRQYLRIRPVITTRTSVSTGLPPSALPSKPSTTLQAGTSAPLARNPLKAGPSQSHDQNQSCLNESSNGQHSNLPAVPNMNNCRSFFGKNPTQATRVHNGNCQLQDPNYLSQFAQYLTGEIQQLDLAIVGIAHGPHDQRGRYTFRRLRNVLVDLRDLCVDIEIEQRDRMGTDETDDV